MADRNQLLNAAEKEFSGDKTADICANMDDDANHQMGTELMEDDSNDKNLDKTDMELSKNLGLNSFMVKSTQIDGEQVLAA